MPRIAPGYDVTTVSRSAMVAVDVRNAFDFFGLEVQIKAAAAWTASEPVIRYVSPALGYIQTHGWHLAARTSTVFVQGKAYVTVPAYQVTVISVAYCLMYKVEYYGQAFLTTVHKGDRIKRWQMLGENNCRLPRLLRRANLDGFYMTFREHPVSFFQGFRLLFSFHQRLFTPRRLPRDLWNCSVPYWPDFRQHLECNYRLECAGQEDEMRCNDSDLFCPNGSMYIVGTCYMTHRLRPESEWNAGKLLCESMGTRLASFPTVNSWFQMVILIRRLPEVGSFYIGLHSTGTNFPHIYKTSLQWSDGSISHYTLYFNVALFGRHLCASVYGKQVYLHYCQHVMSSPYALCQLKLSPVSTSTSTGKEFEDKKDAARAARKKKTGLDFNYHNTVRNPLPFPSTLCPDQHWTQDFLACDVFSACWRDHEVRTTSGVNVTRVNSVTTTTIPVVCVRVGVTSMFPCRNGASSVSYSLVCNHHQDCVDNSDEDFCVFPPCSEPSGFRCANGQCIGIHQQCDSTVQCTDESDEKDCFEPFGPFRFSPPPPLLVDFDGRGRALYTQLSTMRERNASVCPDTHMFCPGDDYCVPVYVRCNGVYDCPGHEDEIGCDSSRCPGLYRCYGVPNICLHPDHLCDGWAACPQLDDEQFCNLTCPADCTCLGHAFTCTGVFPVESFSRIRYLDAGGAGIKPDRFANTGLLIFLSLASCNLTHLSNLSAPNVNFLDLSDNRLSVVTNDDLRSMKNLHTLSLARNPLSTLFSGNTSSDHLVNKGILHVDLAGVKLSVLNLPDDLPFPNLLSLNLSKSGITHLVGEGFKSVASLRVLDLRGCPATALPQHVFKDLKELRSVFADNYKLCCAANLPDGFIVDHCHAFVDEISSCDALLRSDVYRVCLCLLATLALIGNLGCFCLRVFSLKGRGNTGFNVFVTHLCVSDFVMGVYMAIIGVADRLYLGRYLWEDVRWRNSAACQVAGVLAFLSSEVSALIICLITLDRFLVIRFPLRRLCFSPFSAQIASALTWTVGILLATVPVLPATAYSHFYGHTGICVPLPITRRNFTGDDYAFGVMILLNLVVFLMIASGQFSVYLAMTSNAMSSIESTRKSRDLIVARRLISVVVSDFLCWFPLGLLGVLASQGVPIPGEVNVAMAVCILPFNSALNPYLYTLNMIQERRRRATEMKLLKMIMDRGISEDANFKTE